MAIFKSEDETFNRLDWTLLQNGPISLYSDIKILKTDLDWLRNHEYQIDQFECASWQTEADLHHAFATQLNFPDYYGHNMDALNDCLGYVTIPSRGGRIFVFDHFDQFTGRHKKLAWYMLDTIAKQARLHLLFGFRLLTLLQSDDPRIEFVPVGACSVDWNRREWLNKNRGL